jgi:hypothetical protein
MLNAELLCEQSDLALCTSQGLSMMIYITKKPTVSASLLYIEQGSSQ